MFYGTSSVNRPWRFYWTYCHFARATLLHSNNQSKHSMPSNWHNSWEKKVFDHTYPQYTEPGDSVGTTLCIVALL